MRASLAISLLLLSFALHGQEALEAHEVLKLIPDHLIGYQPLEEFKGRKISLGTLAYTLCEKKFTNSGKTIKIMLFDFVEAPIMYDQAMRTWHGAKPVESDSLILRSFTLNNCTGWESYRKRSGTSQIFLGICKRFFLSITGNNIDLAQLKAAIKDINPEKFPKK